MKVDVLSAPARTVFPTLCTLAREKGFYLAGGTGAALQLGHRRSDDLDFFSRAEFEVAPLIGLLEARGRFTLSSTARCTVHGLFEGVKVSFLGYPYPLLFPLVQAACPLADLRDIAAMKLSAIAARGSRKDFIDLFVIAREVAPLPALLQVFEQKFAGTGYNLYHLLKSLTYFADADAEPMPFMLRPISWPEVKKFFEARVRELWQL